MNDWQPGDLALCVLDGRYQCKCGVYHEGAFVRKGAVYEVRRSARVCDITDTACKCVGLVFVEARGLSDRFIKITPGADITGKEVEKRIRIPHLFPNG